jgi:asparagine synthase (glutamine-hydrolysing)
MCGIAGVYGWRASSRAPDRNALIQVRDQMASRGRDGVGLWTSADGRAMFGHRRLAIIDVDARSDQPLGRGPLTIVCNGEIYNYRALRDELVAQGVEFCTQGDTEVVLALFERDGPAAFARLRGMFALAIFDERDASLTIARDPYGIKPLYLAQAEGQLWFASQVKALRSVTAISSEPDPAGLTGFHLWGSIPEPFTLYRAIRALPAGHWQRATGTTIGEPVRFSSLAAILSDAPILPAEETEAQIAEAIRDSVAAHLVADVEVGLFLSAGIDSGALLGAMANAGGGKVRAITIGFEEFDGSQLDEVPIAARVAERYGAEHIVDRLSRADIENNLEHILKSMDQPSIDGVNSWFASRAAHRAGLKVAMSGLGADELLAGYSTFQTVPAMQRRVRWAAKLPGAAAVAEWALKNGLKRLNARQPKASGVLRHGGTLPGAYFVRRALLMPSGLSDVMNAEVMRAGLAALQPVERVTETVEPLPPSTLAAMMALESGNYMKNQLLRDADWSSMAHTLELRVPFVDVPTLCKVASVAPWLGARRGKRALAGVPSPPLPDEIVNRPKSGFATPLNVAIGARGMVDGGGSRDWARRVIDDFQRNG